MSIDSTAIIDSTAQIGKNVTIGAYSVIKKNVIIGDGTIIAEHVVIDENTTMGQGCHIFPFASIGGVPQDLKFAGEDSKLVIGDNNTIREYVTINRATGEGGGVTRLGDNNLLMAYSHVAHDCILGNNIIMANAATLGGHVEINDHAIIGGLVAIHQFTRIGAFAIVGGCSAVSQDVPPFTSAVGNRAKLHGLNLIGLKRNGFSKDDINSLKKAYRILFRKHHRVSEATEIIKAELSGKAIDTLLNFITSTNSKRGICSGTKTD